MGLTLRTHFLHPARTGLFTIVGTHLVLVYIWCVGISFSTVPLAHYFAPLRRRGEPDFPIGPVPSTRSIPSSCRCPTARGVRSGRLRRPLPCARPPPLPRCPPPRPCGSLSPPWLRAASPPPPLPR